MAIEEIKDRRIKTLEQLKELAQRESGLDCFILLK